MIADETDPPPRMLRRVDEHTGCCRACGGPTRCSLIGDVRDAAAERRRVEERSADVTETAAAAGAGAGGR